MNLTLKGHQIKETCAVIALPLNHRAY